MDETEEFIAAIGAINKRLMEAEMAFAKKYEQLIRKNKPANVLATVFETSRSPRADDEELESYSYSDLLSWKQDFESAILRRQLEKLKPSSITLTRDFIRIDGEPVWCFIIQSNKHFFGKVESEGKLQNKHFTYDPFIGKLVELKDKQLIKIVDVLYANRKKIKKTMFGTETPLEDGCDEPKVELHEAVLQVLKEHNLKFPD